MNKYVPASRSFMVDLAMMAGCFALVPSLLITITTSGAIENLLPQRALSVMAVGRDYWACVVLGLLATVAFLVSSALCLNLGDNLNRLMFSPVAVTSTFKAKSVFGGPLSFEAMATPVFVLVSVFLAHVFCWQMGLIYRRHHDRFNWVLQKHDKSARSDTLAQLHTHRQKQMQSRADEARKRMSQRGGAPAGMPLPVAKPVNPR